MTEKTLLTRMASMDDESSDPVDYLRCTSTNNPMQTERHHNLRQLDSDDERNSFRPFQE
jgi:hypothetical protein